MILRELHDLAHREGLVDDPDYEPKPVSYLVVVGPGGQLRAIESTLGAGGAERGPRRMMVPRETVRTRGIEPQFLWDNAEYVFGVSVDATRPRPGAELGARAAAFRELAAEAATCGDEALLDLVRLLERLGRRPLALGELLERAAVAAIAPNAIFAFRHHSDGQRLVSSRRAVRAWWWARRQSLAGPMAQCLVTGELQPVTRAHPRVKRLPGGQPGGAALVSCNHPAFESYGLERGENAPIGRAAGEAVAAALNRLLDPDYPGPGGLPLPSRRVELTSDTAILYWARQPWPVVELFGRALSGEAAAAAAVRAGIEPPSGASPSDGSGPLFVLLLSGEMARAKVRGWWALDLERALAGLRQHFEDTDVERRGAEPLPLWRLLRGLAPRGDREPAAPQVAAATLAAIVEGGAYPRCLLTGALARARAEGEVTVEQAALISGYLRRARRLGLLPSSAPEVARSLDPCSRNVPYRLGRLLAALEQAREEAGLGQPGAPAARRFGAAAARPAAIFPLLLRARRGELLAEELLGAISALPEHLTPEDQGLFALGFYHQRRSSTSGRAGGCAGPGAPLGSRERAERSAP